MCLTQYEICRIEHGWRSRYETAIVCVARIFGVLSASHPVLGVGRVEKTPRECQAQSRAHRASCFTRGSCGWGNRSEEVSARGPGSLPAGAQCKVASASVSKCLRKGQAPEWQAFGMAICINKERAAGGAHLLPSSSAPTEPPKSVFWRMSRPWFRACISCSRAACRVRGDAGA